MATANKSSIELNAIVASLTGWDVVTVAQLSGGRNSRIFRVDCSGGQQLAAKFYPRPVDGERDRSRNEYDALSYLWHSGERAIPEPIAHQESLGCALYQFIDGSPIDSARLGESEIDQATSFLARLGQMSVEAEAKDLPPASEAFFSLEAVLQNIKERLQPLLELDQPKLAEFLTQEFLPALQQVASHAETSLKDMGVSRDQELDLDKRTLSPSDFGFHNALRITNGQVVFLDFEHLGWDDPAKMVSDFLLHPAMNLDEKLKQRFFSNIVEGNSDLAQRVTIAYPVFGLKWCLILLNEFLPGHMARRAFASTTPLHEDSVRTEQLRKSKNLLHKIGLQYANFPYRF